MLATARSRKRSIRIAFLYSAARILVTKKEEEAGQTTGTLVPKMALSLTSAKLVETKLELLLVPRPQGFGGYPFLGHVGSLPFLAFLRLPQGCAN